MALRPRDAWSLSSRALKGWSRDSASSMGAALAFYTLFSLAPLLLVAIAIAGFFIGRSEAQDVLMAELTRVMGERAALGVQALLDSFNAPSLGVMPALIGAVSLVVGATTVFAELRADLNRIWRVPTPRTGGAWEFARTRLLSFGMVVAVGFLLLVSLAASGLVAALGNSWFAASEAIVHALEFASSFLLVTLLFAMIYKLLPDTRIAWRDVWVGAAVTSLLFWLGKAAIAIYIGKAAMGSAFGAAGTFVAVIAWVYYSAQIFFLGAEFTREYALGHGSKQGERHLHEERRRSDMPAANDADIVNRARRVIEVTSTP